MWTLVPVGPYTVSPKAVEPTRSNCVSYCWGCRKEQVLLFRRRHGDDDKNTKADNLWGVWMNSHG